MARLERHHTILTLSRVGTCTQSRSLELVCRAQLDTLTQCKLSIEKEGRWPESAAYSMSSSVSSVKVPAGERRRLWSVN